MNPPIRKLLLLAAMSSATLLAACGGGGGGGSAPSTQLGTVHYSMTDAPACGYDAVNVTVSKIRANKSATASDTDAGWTDITLNPARKINLLTLTNGALTDLGQAPLEVGHYTQTRLVLVANSGTSPLANSVIPTGGTTEIALDTPSAVQSGIKLVNEFDVAAGTLVDLTLDFDACKSVVSRGNGSYGLKPVVTVIPMVVSGAINGVIGPVPTANAVVSAQMNGVIVKSTVPDASGAFSLSPLVQTATGAGYTVVVTADGFATDVVTGVPVVAKTSTAVSTTAAPLMLTTSTANSVSGTVLPVTAAASVRATQTYGTSAPVTVKYQGADLTTGAYGFSLPTSAAMLGAYGTGTLPIILSGQTASAGKYSVEAAADGYTTQAVPVDVTAGAVTHNFTLN